MTIARQPTNRKGTVAVVQRGGRLLVIRRSRAVVTPGAYCFPGGGIESGETEQGALVREFREDLGVDIIPVRRIWESVTSWGVMLAWWQAELPLAPPLTPNPAEVESVHWIFRDELPTLAGLLESNRHFLDALARGEIELR